MKHNKYDAIRWWANRLGSNEYYIKAQQEKAKADNAPELAIYEFDGKWQCLDESSPALLLEYIRHLKSKMD